MARNDLNKQGGILEHGSFSFENSKLYITALILLFHVLPLAFIGSGEMGRAVLNTYGMIMFNPLIIVILMIIYGIKVGFNFKMPLLCILLSTASVPMYYEFANDVSQGVLYYPLISTTISLILYSVCTFISLCVGALIKRAMS